MRNITTIAATLALAFAITSVFALRPSRANDTERSTPHFRVKVFDVIGSEDSVVKQIRIELEPNSRAKIKSDKKGAGGLSASAGTVAGQPEIGVITVTVLVDHIEWNAGNVNALKFLMSIDGNGSKALMSDSGPMVSGKTVSELLTVLLKSGTYEYGTGVPMLRFKDKIYSLTVTAPSSKP
ncbi:hypothetical protein FYK55_00500 [Roseiconus nitratireducens]|uniref:CHRD domain-containing protein n=1 Tax=Roseiconus nitratireducens TaxID=2605748 RepID=A0A5M6DL37_9BACT|nr:hypothetical protein [Roseiconus nitratireducens]KAA5546939.1 hypothetical protein FYK55_00500 [Roseiconus nitratireducens]